MNVKIKEPQIIWEHMENEVIVISLINGHYYNVQGIGMNIWLSIAKQVSPDEIACQIQAHYGLSSETIKHDMQQFIDTLVAEELIILTEPFEPPILPAITIWPEQYAAPTLTKYTDMEELLLIDPIHEVDEHGWPNRYPLPEDAL